MKIDVQEVNFDGLVGPTHHYAGLAFGNIASMEHGEQVSNPKQAALQGLKKMYFLHELGIPQGILPPQERPYIKMLRILGFTGSDLQVIERAWKENPFLLASCSSASSMWAANAATVTPSSDSIDGKVHFTVANLQNRFHRSLEPESTRRLLKLIFKEEALFTIHPPLPGGGGLGDEGAANHTRFCKNYGSRGVHLFVYGKKGLEKQMNSTKKFPPRQSLEASEAICRHHGIPFDHVLFARQNPEAIDAGVFHSDVILVGDRNLLIYHEKAFEKTDTVIKTLSEKVEKTCGCPLIALPISDEQLSLTQAIESYFFNSQLVTLKDKSQVLIAPKECEPLHLQLPHFLPIYYCDVRESMKNGGGPACLRLRVVLTEGQQKKIPPSFLFSETLYHSLTAWVQKHYRDTLTIADLADPLLLKETREALDELTKLLGMGSFYPFQHT